MGFPREIRTFLISSSEGSSGNMSAIPLGSEVRLANNKIYINPANTPLSLRTDYLSKIENYGIGKEYNYPYLINESDSYFRNAPFENSPLYLILISNI